MDFKSILESFSDVDIDIVWQYCFTDVNDYTRNGFVRFRYQL